MTLAPRHMRGETMHARKDGIRNRFRYSVDYLLIDPGDTRDVAPLYGRNRAGLFSLHDRDHGGVRGNGVGAAWAEEVLKTAGLGLSGVKLLLLAQPRFAGYWFNPVAFWFALRGDDLVAVIAEVNNTVGDRHSYLCAHPGFAPIGPKDVITTQKVFHVSPFQEISGDYRFRFSVSDEKIDITIDLVDGNKGMIATLSGPLEPLTARSVITMAVRRPAGALRVMALILWQALKLKAKGATFRKRTPPPLQDVT